MQAERQNETGQARTEELRMQAAKLEHLLGQDVGVYGAGVGKEGLVMLVEEGIEEEFKDVLRSAVPGGQVSIEEIGEPVPLAQSESVS